jgi:hypothetical protein
VSQRINPLVVQTLPDEVVESLKKPRFHRVALKEVEDVGSGLSSYQLSSRILGYHRGSPLLKGSRHR